ncbi:MAG: hypothetical protein RIQ52_1750 [Pseudomonadota bacterium]|jgi:histidinol-phosphate aminotransferase
MTYASRLAQPGILSLSPYIPGKPVSELQRELGISRVVKLASNENPLGPSPLVLEAVRQASQELHLYPDGAGYEVKQALAGMLAVGPEQITLGNGSNEVLELLARVFLGVESEAIYSAHAFAVYPLVTQAVGARGVVAPAHDGSRGVRFAHDLDAMLAKVTASTRLIFIANPNNPTGTWLGADELARFLDALPDHVMTVIDEAYFEYVTEKNYPDTVRWLGRYPGLVVTRTFSKAYGLAGLRLGYSVSSPETADLLNRAREPFNVNHLAQAAAVAALKDRAYLDASVSLNAEGLLSLTSALEARGFEVIPSVGNFVTFDLRESAEPVYQSLLRQGVIVRPVANYALPDHLRVSVGTAQENAAFLAALDRVLRL